MRGMIVVVEGADAAGKHTNTKLLAERISRSGREAVVYSFPRYQTPLGRAILRHLKGDVMLSEQGHEFDPVRRAPEDAMWFQCAMTIDKYEVANTIAAHVANGTIVVCDRWKASAVAYGVADGLDEAWLWKIQECLPAAHLNIFLSCTEEESLRRRPQLRDRYEVDRAKQEAVRKVYADIWERRSSGGVHTTIDANGPTIEAVAERVWQEFVRVAIANVAWK